MVGSVANGMCHFDKRSVGSIFPCVGIGIYQLLRGRSFGKTFFSLLGIGLLSLVPLGIWFWAAYQQGGESFINLMMEENTGRFFRKMSYASHENPLWYNFVTIIWGWIPWTLVLLISLFGLKWKEMRFLPEGSSWSERFNKAWTKFRSQSPLHLFTWVVILFIFIFYCIPKSKRSVYLLPIYPFMAMLIAEYFLALVQRKAKVFKISAYIFASLALLLTVTFIIVRFGLIPDSVWGTGKHAAENIGFMHALENVDLPFSKLVDCGITGNSGHLHIDSVGKAGGYTFFTVQYSRVHFVSVCFFRWRLSAYGAGYEVGQTSGRTSKYICTGWIYVFVYSPTHPFLLY